MLAQGRQALTRPRAYNLGGKRLLERDEARGMCGTNARLAMLHRLVADGKLCQIVADHIWLDLDLQKPVSSMKSSDGGTSGCSNCCMP